jgi:hypothetical protein
MIITKTNQAFTVWDSNLNCLINHWRGQVSEREYKHMMLKSLEFIQCHEVKSYISNMSESEWVWEDAHAWDLENFWSEMRNSHLAFYGLVIPPFASNDLLIRWIGRKLAETQSNVSFFCEHEIGKALDRLQQNEFVHNK